MGPRGIRTYGLRPRLWLPAPGANGIIAASFPVVLGEIANCDVTRRARRENSRSVPSLPQSLESASRPGDEAGIIVEFFGHNFLTKRSVLRPIF